MPITIYHDVSEYITTAATTKEWIARVKATITALQAQRLAMSLNGSKAGVSEYSLDDGQTKIRTVYRSVDELTSAIAALRKELKELQSDLTPRMVKLMDEKNFNYRRGC